jgi:phage-related baseplate assembly protein
VAQVATTGGMADTYTAVDLSRLPAPAVVEELDFDTIYAGMLSQLQALVPSFDATVESDPAVKLLQVAAYREMLLRQRVNDAARAVMPAFALGSDLDHLAALFGVARLLITPADDTHGIPAVYETDTDLRRRMTLAPEGYSVAGPEGAYIFHALSADADVLDASATSPTPGAVVVTVLARSGTGAAGAALVTKVAEYLSDETRRPMTDHVTVQSANVVPFAIEAEITTFAGPDAAIVLATARANLDGLIARTHRLGIDVTRARIFAALAGPEGVQNVNLINPAADVVMDRSQAGWCSGIVIRSSGVGE